MSNENHFGDGIQHKNAVQLVEQFEAMLQTNESHFFDQHSFEHIIAYYENRFEFEKALEVVAYALEQHPFSAQFLVKKAHLLFESKYCDQALALLDRAQIFSPSDLDTALLKAEILVYSCEYEAAIDTLEASMLFADQEEKADIYLAMADVYEGWNKIPLAYKYVKLSLSLRPTHEETLNRMDCFVELTENYAESIDIHTYIIDEVNPYCHLAWYNLGNAYHSLKLYERAIDVYGYVTAIDENYDLAYRNCGDAYYELEDYARAKDQYLEAIAASEADDELCYNIGLCCCELRDLSEAIGYFQKAIVLNEEYHEAYFEIGECFRELGDPKQALIFYNKALHIEHTNSEYLSTLADLHLESENYNNAALCYYQAIQVAPTERAYWIGLIRVYFELGLFEEAQEAIQVAITELEIEEDFIFLLAACMLKNGQKKEAFLQIEKGLFHQFEAHSILFDLVPYLEHDANFLLLVEQYR